MFDGASGPRQPGMPPRRASVLVFAGLDPSGGAGLAADILAIGAMGGHALPVATALTVQDNNRVFAVHPVAPGLVAGQAGALIGTMPVDAIKIGIPGSAVNALAIAALIVRLRQWAPLLPVVLDPVLASGRGDALSPDDALAALLPLLPLATLIVPNLPELRALAGDGPLPAQAARLRARGCQHVLVTGGHADGALVVNRWFGPGQQHDWSLPRLAGAFHGSGCTLAAAIAARLAQGDTMALALGSALAYCHQALAGAYAVGPGQLMPRRC